MKNLLTKTSMLLAALLVCLVSLIFNISAVQSASTRCNEAIRKWKYEHEEKAMSQQWRDFLEKAPNVGFYGITADGLCDASKAYSEQLKINQKLDSELLENCNVKIVNGLGTQFNRSNIAERHREEWNYFNTLKSNVCGEQPTFSAQNETEIPIEKVPAEVLTNKKVDGARKDQCAVDVTPAKSIGCAGSNERCSCATFVSTCKFPVTVSYSFSGLKAKLSTGLTPKDRKETVCATRDSSQKIMYLGWRRR